MGTKVNHTHLELVQGDITDQVADAIVNAANTHLQLGGGVAGAICRKGGPAVQSECDQKGPIHVGQAVLTTAGDLKAKYVIHAVGPRMGEGDEDRKLQQATLNSLKVAEEHGLASLSFCAISTGIYGYPIDRCSHIMLKSTIEYLKGTTGLKRIVFCLFDKPAFEVFERELGLLL